MSLSEEGTRRRHQVFRMCIRSGFRDSRQEKKAEIVRTGLQGGDVSDGGFRVCRVGSLARGTCTESSSKDVQKMGTTGVSSIPRRGARWVPSRGDVDGLSGHAAMPPPPPNPNPTAATRNKLHERTQNFLSWQ